MKKTSLFLAAILMFIFSSCHHRLPEAKFQWSGVVEVPDAPKNILYQRTIEWFNQTFRDMRSVIQSQDKEAGTFYGKAYLSLPVKGIKGSAFVYFTVNISVKDGKYKYEFNNFYHEGSIPAHRGKGSIPTIGNLEDGKPEPTYPKIKLGAWKNLREATYKETESTIESLKRKMVAKAISETF